MITKISQGTYRVARIKLLIDTDIFIDYLKGISPAKVLFRSKNVDIYCSVTSSHRMP